MVQIPPPQPKKSLVNQGFFHFLGLSAICTNGVFVLYLSFIVFFSASWRSCAYHKRARIRFGGIASAFVSISRRKSSSFSIFLHSPIDKIWKLVYNDNTIVALISSFRSLFFRKKAPGSAPQSLLLYLSRGEGEGGVVF